MDFTLSPRIEEFRARIAAFVESEILPVEADRGTWDEHENIGPEALAALRAKAKAAARSSGPWCSIPPPPTTAT
jgi:acyl-CoA dehydrogenase